MSREVPVEQLPGGATVRWYDGADDAALVVWPAMGIPAGKYRRFAELTSEGGPTVVLADYRGQPGSAVEIEPRARWGYREVADGDLRAVLDRVRARLTDARVDLVCHSLGGQLAAALEAEHPGLFDGLVLLASCTPYWRAYPAAHRLGLLVGPTALAARARLRGRFDDPRFGRQSTRLIRDWARLSRTGSWRRGGHTIASRDFPLLAVSFAGDSLAPPSAVDALVRQFAGARVTRRHLDEPRGHAGWLKDPQPVEALLREWSVSRAGS